MTTYGRWTVLREGGRKWLCRCECGTEREVVGRDLRVGQSTNCGCVRRVTMKAAQRAAVTTHGMEKSPEYRTWIDMRRRCNDPRRPDYKNYGARGITVCDDWRESFVAFYRDMGPRPPGHTLDRKDNSGPYSKDNCEWATRKTQERNKRTSRFIEIDGNVITVAEACDTYGIKQASALNRLNLGWSVEDTFKRPLTWRG